MTSPKLFLSYFPQFTAEPLNDEAWYPGFTDWDLIDKLPDDVRDGFLPEGPRYDTGAPDQIADLTAKLRDMGAISPGLMVYHYFFDGRHVLEKFEQNLLAADAAPPFFLCWANETWTKRWVGRAGDIIVQQRHLPDRSIIGSHVDYLGRFFAKDSYFRIEGRPVLMIYNPLATPTLKQNIEIYRELFRQRDIDPLIGCCIPYAIDREHVTYFDFVCEFEPRFFFNMQSSSWVARLASRLQMAAPRLFELVGVLRDRLRTSSAKRQFFYRHYLDRLRDGSIERELRAVAGGLPVMRSTFLSWDNQPRYRERSTSVDHTGVSEADLAALDLVRSDAGLPILVNSWNEWSEGAALEPARRPTRLYRAFVDRLFGSAKRRGQSSDDTLEATEAAAIDQRRVATYR